MFVKSASSDMSCWLQTFCFAGMHYEYGQVTAPRGLSGVTQMSTGQAHSCAVRNTGALACWGTLPLFKMNCWSGSGRL